MMAHRTPLVAPVLLALGSLLAVPGVRAEEGMWLPGQIPDLAPELAAAGMELDAAKLADLTGDPLGAVVSLGGCTASFVSPEGLILTNHHCVYGSVQFNSTPERDLIRNGFLAATRAEELPTTPGSYVYVTTAIRDVTKEVLAGTTTKLGDAELARRVERRERELVDACEKPGGVRCRVASFYEGTQFQLITQLEIRDVRLVYAPAEGIGNFGGEIDNWMWPRHAGDFGVLRAWVGPDGKAADPSPANVPYRPAHWLRLAQRGIQPGELVWIPGYPGKTYRYRTLAEVEGARDFTMPESIRLAQDMIEILERENTRGRQVAIANYGRIRGYANSMKKYEGILLGMKGGAVEEQRAEREKKLGALLASDSKLAAELGDPVAEIAKLEAERRRTERRDFLLEALGRYGSVMYGQANTLWRLAEERPKPDLEREEGYRDRDLSRLLQGIARAQRSIERGSDRAGFAFLLGEVEALPADQRIEPIDEVLAATGKATEEERIAVFLDELYAGTKLDDLALRRQMAKESTAELAAHGDAMIDLARALAPLLAEKRARQDAYDGAMLRVRPGYMKGLARLNGGRLYPDANSTLRFTWGKVKGYAPRDAVVYEPRTTLAGMAAKATGEFPFAAPQKILDAAKSPAPAYRDAALGDVPVDFLSTCDITGGNSGSPTLNGRGEIVGLAFDGNWEGVMSDYLFEPDVVRTIHVDTTYVRWVMDQVDKAHALLREMGLPVVTPD